MPDRPEAVEFFTPRGVRLRSQTRRPGQLNWLFLPGGPGVGSESLTGLLSDLQLPGVCWLVDLPGDGSNTDAPGAPADPYTVWPQVFLEAVDAVPNPVAIGHSTGGEYLLSIPELEARLVGLVLMSTAPSADWMPIFEAMVEAHPLPAAEQAIQRYEVSGSPEDLRDAAVASAPWNFTASALPAGIRLLKHLPYNPAAVEWSDKHFDREYTAAWWPARLPTLIISGEQDRVVAQQHWDNPSYTGPHVARAVIPAAAHFPWLDQPSRVRDVFHAFARQLDASASSSIP